MNYDVCYLLGFGGLGMTEMMVIGMIAVLLFGKKLPEVAKQLGGSYREFRKGLTDLQSQVDVSDAYYSPATSRSDSSATEDYDDYAETTAPKFEPPPTAPVAEKESAEPSGDINKNITET